MLRVPVDGVELIGEVRGQGPPMLLLHGGPGLEDYLAPLAAELERDWTVARYTQRGTEPSVVAAYAERAAALRWDEAALRHIEQALDARWDESLADLYGRLPIGHVDSRRASAQRWLQAHPASPAPAAPRSSPACRPGAPPPPSASTAADRRPRPPA